MNMRLTYQVIHVIVYFLSGFSRIFLNQGCPVYIQVAIGLEPKQQYVYLLHVLHLFLWYFTLFVTGGPSIISTGAVKFKPQRGRIMVKFHNVYTTVKYWSRSMLLIVESQLTDMLVKS